MYKSSFMPLRVSVGEMLGVRSAVVTDQSAALAAGTVRVSPITVPPVPYSQFVAQELEIGGVACPPAPGTATLPGVAEIPPDLASFLKGPVDPASLLRIRAVGPDAGPDRSREFWFEIELNLGTKEDPCPTVGGIYYGGFPYLPYYLTKQGFVSSNYGLPREVRLSWQTGAESGFLDDEASFVHQEMAGHSGIHVIATGPVRATRLRIRFADFPRIVRSTERDGSGRLVVKEFWGVLIPYLGVFAYREDTRYRPDVTAGLIAAVVSKGLPGGSFPDATQMAQPPDQFALGMADAFTTLGAPPAYLHFSAASLFELGREYSIAAGGRVEDKTEVYISPAMVEGDQLRITFAQADENERCLAGLRLTGVTGKTMESSIQSQSGQFDVAVYELDPPEGVSPVAPERDPSADKYATLVAQKKLQVFENLSLTLPFLRPTSARTFALVFTCRGPGRLGLTRIGLIQSAHVVLAPRKSRAQVLRRLNFRLLGRHLAEDYSRLGQAGFKFSIEHFVGGECKEVLFEARSLTDLLQLAGVKIYANARYLETHREVSHETVDTEPTSFERRFTETRNLGWRKSESGRNVAWNGAQGTNLVNAPAGAFETFNNAEVRSKTEHIGFQPQAALLVDAVNAVASLTGVPQSDLVTAPAADRLTQGAGWDTSQGGAWHGITGALTGIDGLLNISAPPVSLPMALYQELVNILQNPLHAAASTLPAALGRDLSVLAVLNGMTAGVSLSPGPGPSLSLPVVPSISVSMSQQLPTLTRTSATGNSGSVTLQASRSGFTSAQSLNEGYDENETHTSFRQSTMERQTVRDGLLPGTVRERVAGVAVNWQDAALDLIVGSIPLTVTLPATADRVYENTDESIRIRFGNGMADGLTPLLTASDVARACDLKGSVTMDVWFDLKEERLKDDY